MLTVDLHENLMDEDLFQPGRIGLCHTHDDRMIVGSAVPTDAARCASAR